MNNPMISNDRKAESKYPESTHGPDKALNKVRSVDFRRSDVENQQRKRNGKNTVAQRGEAARLGIAHGQESYHHVIGSRRHRTPVRSGDDVLFQPRESD